MGTNLHQLLRSLCLDTHWNYAIFWKLQQHLSRMILTWEDAYYDNPHNYDSSQSKCCQKTLEKICCADFSHDPLGLALAKMSYHVYSLREGIVGQVAVTGKHQWICADNRVASSSPSFQFADGWQSQFSAGIRTIVVVAVVPLGVVQLGSLNKVVEDMEVVTHIRSLFLSTHNLTSGYLPSQIQSRVKNPSTLLDVSMKTLSSEIMPAHIHELNSDRSSILLQSMSNMMNAENQKLVEMKPVNEAKCEGDNNGCNDTSLKLQKNVSSFLHSSIMDNYSVKDLISPSENVRVDSACLPSDFRDAVVCKSDELHYVDINQKGVLNVPRPSDVNSQKDTEMSKFHTGSCYKDTQYTLKFPAGYELHEALGPGFLKGSKYFDWAVQENQDVKAAEMSDEISCSQLTSESRPEHLLEAVVTNVCHSNNNVNNGLSFSTPVQAALTSRKNPEVSIHTIHTINSEGYSTDQPSHVREEKYHSLSSSGIYGAISPKSFSSTCPSSCSNQFERSSEPGKNSKKRARPGESCRPRPRDRQLIQDRIKELRELVPNGAKCSIDSLLECTIKHMLFLQSITKHADNLNKFADTKTKVRSNETDIVGSSGYNQGSSWAMEVGGHLKVCSILVENLSKNGQMLVEMLCEEGSHFLEIAEAIRSLGLTILKGATEAHGEKICICFVVEGQNNINLHRLDILWPLVQLLQSKTTTNS